MRASRLPAGGTIDRSRRVTFTFDGQTVEAFEGDTIASALLAANVRVVGRSFKYHRPRGVWGYATEEPNAIVDVNIGDIRAVNERATMVPVREGLVARSVNSKPNARDDRFAYIDKFSRFIPSAFYYKTFIFPDWHLFEPRIRAMAGLGTVDPGWKPKRLSSHKSAHPDVIVIGAGPAGLKAALDASARGESVMLVDEKLEPGGSLAHRDHGETIDGLPVQHWLEQAVSKLEAVGVKLMTATTAFGIYDHNLVGLNQRHFDGRPDTLWHVRPKRIVLATGALERPVPFANNDRPGVMSADAALFYLRRHAVLVGRDVVIASNNSSTMEVAAALAEAGAKVTLVDQRPQPGTAPDGVTLLAGCRVVEALGKQEVTGVVLDDGTQIVADAVLISGGWTPTVHLYSQAKGKLAWSEALQAFVPGSEIEGISLVGAVAGQFTLSEVMAVGGAESGYSISAAWPQPGQKGRVWIDYQHDVTAKDVELAARENFRSVEHLKRYTTLGMATDQGKTSNLNGLALMAAITGRSIPDVGTTTYRPPFTPVSLSSYAGKRAGNFFNPVKRLPLENAHRADGAVLWDYGGWLRPAWFGRGEMDSEIAREVLKAREGVALFDGSPLGKIEVIGPQAAKLLDFIFYNTVSTLKPGKCRYGFILTESGIVYDDGVLVRLADDHFVVSCSSSHVAGVYSMLEDWRQDRFDRSKVFIHNATANYATLTVSGPRARALMAGIDFGGADLSDESLPHMAFVSASWRGTPIRIARVSFTGDRSYEITIPADKAAGLWNELKQKGRSLDAVLLGSEALLLMRAEKGYIIVGKDTDGLTRPMDLGMTAPLEKKKVEFVGKRSLLMEDAQRPDRKEYVGLDVADGGPMLPTGAHGVVREDGRHRSIGYVTSSYFSPTLNRPIALGLIERGMSRHGEIIDIRHLGEMRKARITAPCAFDPEGARLNA